MNGFLKNSLRFLGVLTLTVLLTGCGTFHREWRRAAAEPPPADGLAGRWEGTWVSDKNGHHGRLRALVTPLDQDTYRFRYHATFWKIFRAGYAIDCEVDPAGAEWLIAGSQDLGWMYGGVYTHQLQGGPAGLEGRYSCRIDEGRLQLARPVETP